MKKFLLILFIFFLSGCNKTIKVETSEYVKVKNNEVLVYSDVYLEDLLEISNDIDFMSDNEKIDTDSLGKKSYELLYKVNNKKYSYKIDLEVIDNIAPLVFSGTNKTVYVGYDKDMCNLITYGDNYDGFIECKIDGYYDLNKSGTYKLKYTLTDSSKNDTFVDVTLNVIEKNTNNGSSGENTTPSKTLFSDVINTYKNENTEIGIDVSKWQGNIDFKKVKDAGATFVIIRIGVQTDVLEDLVIDRYYEENIKNAKEAGLKVGVYLYSIATSKEEAKQQANWVVDILNKEKLDLGVVFDWEDFTSWNSYKISFHDINLIADTFLKTIKENGYEGYLYSSKYFLEIIWKNKYNYPVWLAHYTDKTNYAGNYKIWQMCNDGEIDGINGAVDIDIMYK